MDIRLPSDLHFQASQRQRVAQGGDAENVPEGECVGAGGGGAVMVETDVVARTG